MAAIIASPQEFKEALRDGQRTLDLKALEFNSEDDCIDVSEYLLYGNGLILRGTGATYADSAIYRNFNGTKPLLYFPHDRDWELRLSGIIFDGRFYDGKSLVIDYCQQSLFYDLAFRYHGSEGPEADGVPFIINGPTSNYDFIQMVLNRGQGTIGNAAAVRWISGLSQSDWNKRGSGLKIQAGPHNPPYQTATALRVQDFHVEGSTIDIEGFESGVVYDGGHHNAASVNFINCKEVFTDMSAGTWLNSELKMNNTIMSPANSRKETLWKRLTTWW